MSVKIDNDKVFQLVKELSKELNKGNLSHNERKSLETEINNLKKGMYDYENNISYNKYLNETKMILEEYNKVASNKSKGVIIFRNIKETEDETIVHKRVKIIQEYLNVSKKHIRLEIIHKSLPKVLVDEKVYISVHNGLYYSIKPNGLHKKSRLMHKGICINLPVEDGILPYKKGYSLTAVPVAITISILPPVPTVSKSRSTPITACAPIERAWASISFNEVARASCITRS
jgi:hypothetical protein